MSHPGFLADFMVDLKSSKTLSAAVMISFFSLPVLFAMSVSSSSYGKQSSTHMPSIIFPPVGLRTTAWQKF